MHGAHTHTGAHLQIGLRKLCHMFIECAWLDGYYVRCFLVAVFFSVCWSVLLFFFSSLLSLISIEYVYHLFIYTRTQTCKIQFVSCDFLFIFVFFYSSCSFVATHCNQFMVLTNQSQKNITFLLCDFFMSVCMWYTTRISTNYIWNYFLFWSSLHNSCSHKIN